MRQRAGLSVIEDKINRRGGVCRLDEKIIVIYDRIQFGRSATGLLLRHSNWPVTTRYTETKLMRHLKNKVQ